MARAARRASRSPAPLIGRLQSNKAAEAVALFDIDPFARPPVAARRAGRRPAARRADFPSVYVQVNIGEEEQKGGCAIAELGALARRGPRLAAAARRADGIPPPGSSRRHISRCSPSWRGAMTSPG